MIRPWLQPVTSCVPVFHEKRHTERFYKSCVHSTCVSLLDLLLFYLLVQIGGLQIWCRPKRGSCVIFVLDLLMYSLFIVYFLIYPSSVIFHIKSPSRDRCCELALAINTMILTWDCFEKIIYVHCICPYQINYK